jgi:hypothetical protein
MGGLERAEYVNLAEVDITCIAKEWAHDQLPNIPDVPWEEDGLI